MKLTDVIRESDIISELESTLKADVIRELAVAMTQNNHLQSVDNLVSVLWERERLGSTGIGDGVAIPHGKIKEAKDVMVIFGRSTHGVDFDSIDKKPTNLFFLLVASEGAGGAHLKVLARISRMLRNGEFRRKLLTAKNGAELYKLIAEEDDKV